MTTEQFARDPTFWHRMGRAMIIGLIAGAAAVAFTQLVRLGTDLIWPEDIDYDWLGGEWWWVVVLGTAGVLVGTMRVVLKVPDDLSGSLTILQESAVDRSTALQAIAISVVSLVGGSSLGPFDGGIRSGAMVGDWYTTIRRLPEEEREVATFSGINGSLGGLLTAPILATLLATELRWPEKRDYYRRLMPALTAALFGFALNFALVGDTFLGVFALPDYDVRFWHFAVAIALGVVAATVSWLMGITVFYLRRWVVPAVENQIVRSTIGGLALGVIAMTVPLTLASGKGQMSFAIDNLESLSAVLLVVVVLAKILALSLSLVTGFIGGPVMPSLFIGGISGLAIHALVPEIPVALAFAAMLVAVPGVSVGAPFSMVLLAGLTVGTGAVNASVAGVAVVTAYTLTAGLGWFGLPTERAAVDIDEVTVQAQLFTVSEEGLEPQE
jgi:H+/Cl- antiporter ClcA